MVEHTEGDWEVLSDGLTIKAKFDYKPHYDVESPQTFVAKCFQNGHLGRSKHPTEEDLANAFLIAAAPDLMDACEKYQERIELFFKLNPKVEVVLGSALGLKQAEKQGKAALAKAKKRKSYE